MTSGWQIELLSAFDRFEWKFDWSLPTRIELKSTPLFTNKNLRYRFEWSQKDFSVNKMVSIRSHPPQVQDGGRDITEVPWRQSGIGIRSSADQIIATCNMQHERQHQLSFSPTRIQWGITLLPQRQQTRNQAFYSLWQLRSCITQFSDAVWTRTKCCGRKSRVRSFQTNLASRWKSCRQKSQQIVGIPNLN